MERSNHVEGVQIAHLLQIQSQLTKAITDAVTQAKDDVIARMEEGHGHLTARINELKAKQDVANGRVSKLERTQERLRALVDLRLRDTGTFWRTLTSAQKAKLATVATLVITAVAEGVHRLIPLLLDLLSKTAQAGSAP